jgi:hypothetical protein
MIRGIVFNGRKDILLKNKISQIFLFLHIELKMVTDNILRRREFDG